MAVVHQSLLSGKLIIHIDIKYHVPIDVLIFRLNLPFPQLIRCSAVNLLKYNTDVCRLILNILITKFSPLLPVNFIILLISAQAMEACGNLRIFLIRSRHRGICTHHPV